MTTSGSHCVGTQDEVAYGVTEPGCHSDQFPCRNSEPKRRWK